RPSSSRFGFTTNGCDSSAYGEITIWDLGSGKIDQVTDIVAKLNRVQSKRKDPVIEFGIHHTFWFDDHTLLIGSWAIRHFLDPQSSDSFQQMASYQWPGGTEHLLNNARLDQWLMNPISKQIVYQTVDESSGKVQFRLQLGTFDGRRLQRGLSLAPGCRFSWSPDGRFLAYATPNSPMDVYWCRTSYDKGFTFVDPKTNRISSYQATGNVVGLGWIPAP
ncbi:MAG: hypothetical protein ABI947_27140, partial [Chloroflexota bacterium]